METAETRPIGPNLAVPAAAGGRSLHRFANPGRFLRLAGRVQPWLTGAALLVLAVGLPWGLGSRRPTGSRARRSASSISMSRWPGWRWAAILGLAIGSIFSPVWRHPLADLACREPSPIGAAVTALCLATGSLWGKPMWGTWWVWERG